MATRVDFYLINANDDMEKLQFLCKLLEKAYKQRHQIFVLCQNSQQTHQLDELLWTFNDISFIPHNIVGEGPEPLPPIQLGENDIPQHHRDIIVSLKDENIPTPNHYRRIIKIVGNDDTDKENARQHYRHYRKLGCQLHSHDLTK